MENEEKAEGTVQKPIIYLGHDSGYLEDLKKSYRKNFPHLPNTFVQLKENEADRVQALYLKLLDLKPKMVIVDLSLNGVDYLQLARLIVRVNATKKTPIIAIFDNLSSELIPASVISGIKYNFLKTSDFYSLCRSVMYCLNPDDVGEAELATATLNDKVEAFECCQIGFVNEEMIHLELNKSLKKDETIKVRTVLQKNNIIPSKEMDLISSSDQSLFYNYNYNAQLKFRFADAIIKDDHPAGEIPELELARSSAIQAAQEKLKNWLKKNQNDLPEKFLRTLIIQRELSFLDEDKRTDSYDFLIRLHPYSLDSKNEIGKLLPHLIVFQFDMYESEEEKPVYTNDQESLKALVSAVKSFDNYNPYIVVFNSLLASNTIKERLNYPNVIAYDKALEVDGIIKIVEVLKHKMKDSFEKISSLNPLFIKKNNPDAMAEIGFHLKLIKMNECELMFESDYPLEAHQVIHLDMPINMYATITHENFERPEIKKAIISGADELGLNNLRRYINGVFFREKEAQRAEEKAAVEKLKQDAIRKKKQEHEAALAAAEEAKRKAQEEKDNKAKREEKAKNAAQTQDNAAQADTKDLEEKSQKKDDSKN